MTEFRAGLHENGACPFRLLFSLLRCDFSFAISQIGLVSDQHDNHIVTTLTPDIIYPFPRLFKRL